MVRAETIRAFFVDNVPSAGTLAVACPAALAWAAACLLFAGILKRRWQVKTGYTRKVFHFLIFGTVVFIQVAWGLPGVCVFGGMTSLVIAYALFRGPGNLMYESMAREKDEPKRTYYVVVPYFATLLGGLVSNLAFPSTAVFGYLVTGLGDAVAEPVGTRFGRHQYRVPTFSSEKAVRSLEGSFAVFVVSVIALSVWVGLWSEPGLSGGRFLMVLFISAVSTFVEAVSPHGWDNAFMQIVPSFLACF